MSHTFGSFSYCECGEKLRLRNPDIISEIIYRGQQIEKTLGQSWKYQKMPRTGLGSWTDRPSPNVGKRWTAIFCRLCKIP
jgi:hypothetical protein